MFNDRSPNQNMIKNINILLLLLQLEFNFTTRRNNITPLNLISINNNAVELVKGGSLNDTSNLLVFLACFIKSGFVGKSTK